MYIALTKVFTPFSIVNYNINEEYEDFESLDKVENRLMC